MKVSLLDFNTDIRNELFLLHDSKYKSFHQKLIPNVNPDKIIGIRTPQLKRFKKSLTENVCSKYLDALPHQYYEENNLHAFIINDIAVFDECIKRVNEFLPFVDNWATCDGLRPKCFSKNKEFLACHIDKWLNDGKTYTVRFGIEMLMIHFLDDYFSEEFLWKVCNITSEDYYVNMMIAWYFATALATQYQSTVEFLEQHKLPLWVHNKTIQKAVESFRITETQKTYLKSLRRKS